MSGFPEAWAELALLDACTKITDGTHHSPPNGASGAFKYVTAKNIKRYGLDLSDLTYVTAEVHEAIYARCPVEKGDVLYIKDGATTGVAVNNPLEEPFSVLSSVALLKPDRCILDERFLRHWLNNPDTLSRMIEQMSGSAIRRLTLTTINGQRLPLPPLAEQRRIVAKLDALTARTARARADLDRIPALAARYKQAVLAKAFSGELTAGAPQSGPGWQIKPLGDLIHDGPTNGWSPPTSSAASGTLSLKLTATTSGELRLDERAVKRLDQTVPTNSKFWLEPGDLLIQRANALEHVGASAIFDGPTKTYVYPDLMMRLRISDPALRHLVWRYLNSEPARRYFRENATGTSGNMPKINGQTVRSLMVPVPPAEVRVDLVSRIEWAFAEIDRLSAEAAAARRLLDRLDQAVLAKAFRGELVPQDPADEPASVLLDRIRAERAAAPKAKRGRKAAA